MNTMKHFERNEWMKYVSNQVDSEKRSRMEEHLYTCEECLQTYIVALEEADNHSVTDHIHPNFTDKVINKIKVNELKTKQRRETSQAYKLAVYAVAACMTLLITFSGALETLDLNLKGMTDGISNRPRTVENMFINGWSDRLTQGTKDIIKKIDSNI